MTNTDWANHNFAALRFLKTDFIAPFKLAKESFENHTSKESYPSIAYSKSKPSSFEIEKLLSKRYQECIKIIYYEGSGLSEIIDGVKLIPFKSDKRWKCYIDKPPKSHKV